MISYQEALILSSTRVDLGLLKNDIAYQAVSKNQDKTFDYRVALAFIDKLISYEMLCRDRSGFIVLTDRGLNELRGFKDKISDFVKTIQI